uniref:Vomeronasal type-1 receptor n=1 Tax=Sciurus vulgaris TaxID=55149 RepID=A0A8D2D1A1_SCIVU
MKNTNQLYDFTGIRNALFSEVGSGISANTILLLFHIFTFLLQHKLKPTDLIIGVLALIHLGMLIILGCTGTNVFVSQDFWDDIKCKSFIYLYRFLRGFSICATCLLSVVQAITLSPRSSCLAKFKHRSPHQKLCSLMLMWIFYVVFSAPFSYSSTAILNVTSICIVYNTKLCMILSMSYIQRHLFSVLGVFRDVFLIGLMALSSGYMVFLLCRHKRYFHSRFSTRSSPEQRATHTLLLLISCFEILYCVDSIISLFRGMTCTNDPILVFLQMLVANGYGTISPLVLISADTQIIKVMQSKWRNKVQLLIKLM